MTSFVALLRAVNVGKAGRLPMTDLKALCEDAGFQSVRTLIASGNVIFRNPHTELEVKSALEVRLREYAGMPVGVLIRTAAEMTAILAANPFTTAPANRVVVIFLNGPTCAATLDGITGQSEESICLGHREIYIRHGTGMARTKLRIPAARTGTARNMNTVASLAAMSLDE